MENKDLYFMNIALDLAKKAGQCGEVPVGAVIVDKNGEIISKAYNLRETQKNSVAHAEIVAIQEACKVKVGWRLSDCTLYVTLEPCPMCTGAIINSRIKRVVFGAYDMQAGCCGSVANFNSYPFNHSFEILGGVMEDECREVLTEFFNKKRNRALD